MSNRQATKELAKSQQQQDILAIIEAAEAEERLAKKPQKSAFQAFAAQDSSSEPEEEEEVQVSKVEVKQPKKRKNKKKKVDSDDEFLNQVIKETTPSFKGKVATVVGDSVLKMDRACFNYRKELRSLFSQLQSGNTQQVEEEKKAEPNNVMGDMAGYTKKQKRTMLLQEKMRVKTKAIMSKRLVLCQPDSQNWPRIDPTLLRMVSQHGVFTFQQSPQYRGLQREFAVVQQTMDIHQLIQFLQRNFYHHESLVYFADFLRLQGRFSEAADFLDRCLYAFESSFSFDFQFVQRDKGGDFTPKIELDLSPSCEPLNKVFCECLVKYIDILGRKGCNRTAMEFCKLLLGLSPKSDQYGVLLRYDFYAIRAKEYSHLLNFVRQFCQEVHGSGSLIVFMPNTLLSCAIAKHSSRVKEVTSNDVVVAAVTELNKMESIDDLIQSGPEALVMAACLLYPDLVAQMLLKIAKQQMNSDSRRSYYKGMQAKTWTEILQHPLFSEVDQDLLSYEWVSDNEDTEHRQSVRQMVYSIYIERSSILFQSDLTLLWLKQCIGHLLNELDTQIEQVDFVCKIISLVPTPPFTLDRYLNLKIADFTEDVTTINPADLLGGPEHPQQHQQQPQQQQQQQHEAMIQQVINQLNQPVPQNQPQQPDFMLQQIDPEIAAALDPEELAELQQQLMQGMGHEEFEEWEDEEQQDPGFIQDMMNRFAQWRNGGEEEKKQ